MPPGSRRMIRSVLGIAFSRGFGLGLAMAISILLANRLGAGAETDAFFFARRITTGLAEAAYRVAGIALVPALVAALQAGSGRAVVSLYRRQTVAILAWSLPVTAVLSLLAPWIVRALGPGLEGETLGLAVHIIRIMFFLVPAMLYLAVSTSLLNAGRVYGLPSILAQFSRVLVVVSLVFLVPPRSVSFLAWVMLAGSVGAGLVLAVVTERRLPVMETIDAQGPGGAGPEAGRLLWPGLVFFGVGQLSVWMDFGFASTVGTGQVSVLEYGYRFIGILPGLLSASMNTVLYTEFAHQAADGDPKELQRSLARSARAGLFVMAPIVGFIAFQGQPLLELMLRHGEFGAETAAASGKVMLLVGPGIVLAFIMRMYVFGMFTDSRVAHLKFVAITMSLGLAAQFLMIRSLIPHLGIHGVALGSCLGSIAMLAFVFIGLYRVWGRFLKLADLRSLVLVLVLTAGVMGGVRWLDLQVGLTAGPGNLARAAGLVAAGAAGLGGYLGLAALLRLPELRAAREMLRRKKR